MNKEVIKLTEEIGKVYVEISKLKARKEVLDAKIWEARTRDINKSLKEYKHKGRKNRSKKQN